MKGCTVCVQRTSPPKRLTSLLGREPQSKRRSTFNWRRLAHPIPYGLCQNRHCRGTQSADQNGQSPRWIRRGGPIVAAETVREDLDRQKKSSLATERRSRWQRFGSCDESQKSLRDSTRTEKSVIICLERNQLRMDGLLPAPRGALCIGYSYFIRRKGIRE